MGNRKVKKVTGTNVRDDLLYIGEVVMTGTKATSWFGQKRAGKIIQGALAQRPSVRDRGEAEAASDRLASVRMNYQQIDRVLEGDDPGLAVAARSPALEAEVHAGHVGARLPTCGSAWRASRATTTGPG